MKESRSKERPAKMAAAIKYDSLKDSAPRITARGRGNIAEKIIKVAEENGIPIKNDPELIQILSKLNVDSEIPIELYKAVAEILAFIYTLNESQRPAGASENI
jgi:flagellar biosynthesis protein